MIVFDDADLDLVAETLRFASYWNSGQDCTAATRVIAGPKVYDNFVAKLAEQVKDMKWGDPTTGDELEMGSLISKAQVARVTGMVDRVHLRLGRIGSVPIEHPFGGIRVHVLQSPLICVAARWGQVARGKVTGRAGASSVFPLGFSRQPVSLPVPEPEPLAEFLRLETGDIDHRMIVARRFQPLLPDQTARRSVP